jgi:hypothetical protein
MLSSAVTTWSSRTSNRSEISVMNWRTSTSGADAPAVIPKRADAVQPVEIDFFRPLHKACGRTRPLRDLYQPKRIGAVRRPDHEHQVATPGNRLDRSLPVGRRVADVFAFGPD